MGRSRIMAEENGSPPAPYLPPPKRCPSPPPAPRTTSKPNHSSSIHPPLSQTPSYSPSYSPISRHVAPTSSPITPFPLTKLIHVAPTPYYPESPIKTALGPSHSHPPALNPFNNQPSFPPLVFKNSITSPSSNQNGISTGGVAGASIAGGFGLAVLFTVLLSLAKKMEWPAKLLYRAAAYMAQANRAMDSYGQAVSGIERVDRDEGYGGGGGSSRPGITASGYGSLPPALSDPPTGERYGGGSRSGIAKPGYWGPPTALAHRQTGEEYGEVVGSGFASGMASLKYNGFQNTASPQPIGGEYGVGVSRSGIAVSRYGERYGEIRGSGSGIATPGNGRPQSARPKPPRGGGYGGSAGGHGFGIATLQHNGPPAATFHPPIGEGSRGGQGSSGSRTAAPRYSGPPTASLRNDGQQHELMIFGGSGRTVSRVDEPVEQVKASLHDNQITKQFRNEVAEREIHHFIGTGGDPKSVMQSCYVNNNGVGRIISSLDDPVEQMKGSLRNDWILNQVDEKVAKKESYSTWMGSDPKHATQSWQVSKDGVARIISSLDDPVEQLKGSPRNDQISKQFWDQVAEQESYFTGMKSAQNDIMQGLQAKKDGVGRIISSLDGTVEQVKDSLRDDPILKHFEKQVADRESQFIGRTVDQLEAVQGRQVKNAGQFADGVGSIVASLDDQIEKVKVSPRNDRLLKQFFDQVAEQESYFTRMKSAQNDVMQSLQAKKDGVGRIIFSLGDTVEQKKDSPILKQFEKQVAEGESQFIGRGLDQLKNEQSWKGKKAGQFADGVGRIISSLDDQIEQVELSPPDDRILKKFEEQADEQESYVTKRGRNSNNIVQRWMENKDGDERIFSSLDDPIQELKLSPRDGRVLKRFYDQVFERESYLTETRNDQNDAMKSFKTTKDVVGRLISSLDDTVEQVKISLRDYKKLKQLEKQVDKQESFFMQSWLEDKDGAGRVIHSLDDPVDEVNRLLCGFPKQMRKMSNGCDNLRQGPLREGMKRILRRPIGAFLPAKRVRQRVRKFFVDDQGT